MLSIPRLLSQPNKTLTLTLTLTFSTSSPTHRHRRRKPPAPLDPSALDLAIASLPPRFTSSDLSSAIASAPDPRLAPRLLSWALHRHPLRLRSDPSPFLAAIRRLSNARLRSDLAVAASLALSLPSLSLAADPHLNSIIRSFAHARMVSHALHVYKRMLASDDPAVRPDLTTFRLLFSMLLEPSRDDTRASSYVYHLNMSNASMLFRQMVGVGVAPDRFVLNAVIKGYALSLHLNDALRVFHQMVPVYGVEPNVDTYDCLVLGLCKQGRTRNARELFDEMFRKGMVPGLRVCNALVCAMAMAGEVEEAVEVMWAVARKGRGVDRISCRTLIEETCRKGKGKMEDAMRLLKEMEERELVDGWLFRDLMHCIQDEFDDTNNCRDYHSGSY